MLLLSHSTAGQLPLAAHTTFYDPGVQAPELADVIQTPETHWRTPAQKTASLVLHPRHAIWYRISLYNDQPETQTLLLRDSSPVTDTMSSYLCLEPNNVHSCRKNLKHAHNKNLQVVQLLPQQSATLFVEATGFHSSIFTLATNKIRIHCMAIQTAHLFRLIGWNIMRSCHLLYFACYTHQAKNLLGVLCF
ncbi:MAG: 7TM-DISM domain-containing protein [Pseudomonadales bacterium]